MNTRHENRITYPILFGFFVMGFVDLVGIATNYIKEDFALSDTSANLIPMMVFLWFALFSIPTGVLMGKIGKKQTVIMALVVTSVAMLIPILSYSFMNLLFAFALLGIGNTILQVSLNPMLAGVVPAGKVAGTLTLGQFIKSISSFLGPIVAGAAATFWGNWKLTFVLYAAVSLLSTFWVYVVVPQDGRDEAQHAGFFSTLSLLADKKIGLLFLGILLIVGVDVGLNTALPHYLTVRADLPLSTAGLGSSLYFAFRTLGTFSGALLLVRTKPRSYLIVNMGIAVLAFLFLLFVQAPGGLFAAISILGFTCSSVFPILFSYALQQKPDRSNEISALMIMGVSGGALVTPVMGMVSDRLGVTAGLSLLLFCLLYLAALSMMLQEKNK
ncbi:MAG: MFS transporter [Parabacteroides sp.]|nr:MFS transporter [Parabacteroides sp.]